ncbi:unnamed protein product [Pedinophyceae sp. YPF-701]|nr:unnamed protein product [Pedinophyceae sp. YPF-701]
MCRAVYYCGPECQKKHWKEHRSHCKQVTAITVEGHTVEEVRVPASSVPTAKRVPRGWVRCPVPHMLGVPLYIKRGLGQLSKQVFQEQVVYMMVDPVSGFAPPDWQGGPAMGFVGKCMLARADGADMSNKVYRELFDYIWYLMDFYTEGRGEEVAREMLDPESFAEHVASRRGMIRYDCENVDVGDDASDDSGSTSSEAGGS